jgi:hypothetical protein
MYSCMCVCVCAYCARVLCARTYVCVCVCVDAGMCMCVCILQSYTYTTCTIPVKYTCQLSSPTTPYRSAMGLTPCLSGMDLTTPYLSAMNLAPYMSTIVPRTLDINITSEQSNTCTHTHTHTHTHRHTGQIAIIHQKHDISTLLLPGTLVINMRVPSILDQRRTLTHFHCMMSSFPGRMQ